MSISSIKERSLYNVNINQSLFSKIKMDDKVVRDLMFKYIVDCPVKGTSLVSKFRIEGDNKTKITQKINSMLDTYFYKDVKSMNITKIIKNINRCIDEKKEFYYCFVSTQVDFDSFFSTIRNSFAHTNFKYISSNKGNFLLLSNLNEQKENNISNNSAIYEIKSIALLKIETMNELFKFLEMNNDERNGEYKL